jgi:WD40 repeat protein
MEGKVYFTASNSRQNGIACFDPENDTIETIEELPVNASAVSFSGDGRYLAWIYDENGSLKLFSCDTQTRETRQLSSGISEEFGIATLFVNDGICTVQEESSLGSFAISYDLASGDKLSEKLIPEEFEVNKLQGSRKLLSLTDGIGKDALVYMGTHGSEGFIPLFKESGEHISSFSSHILEDRIVINSQNPPELMVIYPEEGLYETIALDAPLFAARISSDGLFTGVDTQGNQIICIELK